MPRREQASRPSPWAVSAGRDPDRLWQPYAADLLLSGWPAGLCIIPEGLAAPYAHSLHGSTPTVGLLMATMPLGMVVGAVLLGRIATPSVRMRMMGWLAILSCAPLFGSAWEPPL